MKCNRHVTDIMQPKCGPKCVGAPSMISRISDILETHPHDTSAFVEGLAFHESGTLYESNGHYGKSYIRSLHPPTGSTARSKKLPFDLFAEAIAISGNCLLQLTCRENLMLEFISGCDRILETGHNKG